MKKKPGLTTILLCVTGLLCIASLIFLSYNTYQQIRISQKDLESAMEQITKKQQELKEDEEIFTAAVESKEAAIQLAQRRAAAAQKSSTRERAVVEEAEEETKPSVFSQAGATGNFSDSSTSTASNGHTVGIDPGHQSEAVDMSAMEPNGPGSSEMKMKCTGGTQGSYTGVPEYQLNLEVSLKLRDVLESRGYRVVMTRTDNETAISNMERAQYVAAQGADICVRIHANGDDSHTVSGALTMGPSSQNPYVPQLYDSSSRLSQCVLDAYCQATGFANLGIQYTDTMTGINWSTIPVTILEMGFMTYEDDDRKMNDDVFQNTMAEGIANGIDAYFNS